MKDLLTDPEFPAMILACFVFAVGLCGFFISAHFYRKHRERKK